MFLFGNIHIEIYNEATFKTKKETSHLCYKSTGYFTIGRDLFKKKDSEVAVHRCS